MLSCLALQRRRRKHRPTVEALEHRIVPAIAKVQDLGGVTVPQFVTTANIMIPAQGVTAGNSVVVAVTTSQGDTTQAVTVSDAAGNTYAKDVDIANVNSNLRTLLFSSFASNAIAGGSTIAINFVGGGQIVSNASATEFSGALVLDQAKAAFGASATPTTGLSGTTSQAGELVIGAIGVTAFNAVMTPAGTSFTAGSGFTTLDQVTGISGNGGRLDLKTEFQISNSAGQFQADGTLGNSRAWAAALATYREATPLQANPVAATVVGNSATNNINVLAGNVDPLGGVLSIKSITAATNGIPSLLPGNSGIIYTPNPGFVGTDTFTYTIQSSKGGSATATVTITVTAPPVPTNTGGGTSTGGNTIPIVSPTLKLNAPSARAVVVGRRGVVSFLRSRLAVRQTNSTAPVRLQILASAGKLQLRGRGIRIVGGNTRRLVVTGAAAAINRALANLVLKLDRPGSRATMKLSATAAGLSARAAFQARA